MRDFKIWEQIRKWWWVVALFSVACSAMFYVVINNQQSYTAQSMIEYIGENAASGLTPVDTEIDVTEIFSSSTIQNAIDELGLSRSVDFLRNKITVTPVIDKDEETRKAAILDAGNEYKFFPTRYIVSFSADSNYDADFARRVLDAVLDNYLRYYCTTHVNAYVVPDNCTTAQNSEYDYLESIEIIDATFTQIIDYLKAREAAYPTFRSSATGYDFKSLLEIYTSLKDIYIDKLYAEIYENALTKDSKLLLEKYNKRKLDNDLAIISNNEKCDAILALMDAYVGKSVEGQQRSGSAGNEEGGYVPNNNTVIGFESRNETPVNRDTSYDKMTFEYVSYLVASGYCEKDNEDINYAIEQFEKNSAKNTSERQAEFIKDRDHVIAQSNAYYDLLSKSMDEFNDYLAIQNIAVRSSISVHEGFNVTLYLMVAMVLFIMVGVIGVVVLGYLANTMNRYLNIDPKTNLPNRLSCDRMIFELQSAPLEKNTVCVVIQVANLLRVNDEKGREYGDVMLKNIGLIIKNCAASYGTIAYNGGDTFIGVFAGCALSRAHIFRQNIIKAVAAYNLQFKQEPIDMKCALNEAGEAGLYDIRDLLRKTVSDVREQ